MIVKLSGGRSSARMLRLLLDDGRFVRGRDFAVFTNTGLEHNETLSFLAAIEREWDVNVVWLEYDYDENRMPKESFRVVNYETAARDGRPFWDAMTQGHCGIIPHTTSRKCTVKTKIAVSDRWQAAMGFDDPLIAIGYRKGEEARRARTNARDDDRRICYPLMDAGIDSAAVIEWWRRQSFDLRLPTIDGATLHGNCIGCHLKGTRKLLQIFHECPSRADFYIRLEAELERKRNQRECRWWLARETEDSAWRRIAAPEKWDDDKHRRDSDGQVWEHDGRWHRVSILPKLKYAELKEMAMNGNPKKWRARTGDIFLDSENSAVPCECGD